MRSAENEVKQMAVVFDSQVYSLIAIKKAAYKYLDAFSADISVIDNKVHCLLSFPSSNSDEGCSIIIDDFKKEVLDQDLREKIRVETESVRNLILAYAFSKTGIVSNEQISGDRVL